MLNPTSYLETAILEGLPGSDTCTNTTSASAALKDNLCILRSHQYFQVWINVHGGFLSVCAPAVKVYVRTWSQQSSTNYLQHSWVCTSTQEPKSLAICCCQEPHVLTKWEKIRKNKQVKYFLEL